MRIHSLTFVFAISICLHANAQSCLSTCSGNLGDNIFPNGDFGSGTANILQTDPKLAPGYTYTIYPPPNDGLYTITNNTTSWGSYAANDWVNIEDNGPEPNGYMMVVNASYTPGLFFEKKVPVCENTLYQFSIDVISVAISRPGYSPILPNLSFLIDDKIACSTGDVAANGQWFTYRFSFNTAPGVTEVKLSLRNNAPGGIGNDLAIDNISFRACGPKIDLPATVEYCAGESVTLNASFSNSPYATPVYQWQTFAAGAWADVPGATNPTLPLSQPQNGDVYRLAVANSPGNLQRTYCRAVSFPVKLAPQDLSAFEISGTDTIVCNGAAGILGTSGTYASYQWSTGTTASTEQAPEPGWYALSVTTTIGCKAHDSIYVYEVRLAASAKGRDPLCFGYRDGEIEVGGLSGGTGTVRFFLNDNPPQTSPLFANLPAGNYQVTAIDSLGCKVVMPLALHNPEALTVHINAPQTVEEGNVAPLSSSVNRDPVSYLWTPSENLSCANCPNPVATPDSTVRYILTVRDRSTCSAADTLNLQVTPSRLLYAPNVFLVDAASSDNSYFSLFPKKSAVWVNKLAIFDRWGTLVFTRENLSSDDQALRWSGIDNQQRALEQGVYTWLAEIRYFDGIEALKTGDVLLLRNF